MWNINRLYCLGMGLILGSLIFQTSAFAQQPFSWESNLENAQRLAAQSNRLVLIHFWAPWCGACKRMEEEVFNQPAIGAALQANYVPVRINADLMPATAKQYGITALPTQVIITPQGNVVDVIRGRSDASQIVFRLNQVAAAARQEIAGQRAQVPASIPARSADRPITEQFAANNQPSNVPNFSDGRYADYFRGDSRNPQSASAATVPQEALRSSPISTSPSYAQQQPIVGPDLNAQASNQAQANSMPPVYGTSPPVMANVPRQVSPAANLSLPPPVANAPQQVAPVSNLASPALTASLQRQVPPAANAASLSSGSNPPICLDGFCPVSLTEKQQWVPGDHRWGAIHRGRTYLFAGAEEQRRFFTDPDRYAPVISGNDIVQAVEKGQTITGMREHGVLFNNHVFLFADEAALEKFSKNPAYYANQALQAIQASNHTGQQLR